MKVHQLLVALAPLSLIAPTTAQVKYAVSPAGYEFQAANSGNTFPLGRTSASYQQIHDSVDMGALNGGQPMILGGMHFRPAKSYSMTARSFEVQITLSVTNVTAASMSTTFASNLGASTSVVLPYTKMSLPAGAGNGSNPNAPLWKFPFKNIFIYSAASGNLCWDWRQRNSTSTTNTFFDYTSLNPTNATLASVGTGCTATGQTSPATSNITPSGSNLVAGLANGRASSPAFAVLGLSRLPTPLWCGTLHVVPAIILGGVTDSSGTWNAATFPSSTLSFAPYREVFMQYAFGDAGLTGGVGLSNYAVGGPPANGKKYIARLWNVSTSSGAETATTGSKALNGLVTMFTIL